MFDQEDFYQLAEMVSKAVIFQLDTSMLQLENKICDRITGVETRLEERITKVETRLEEKIAEVEIRLEERITEVETRLEERITEVETKFDERLTNLEMKYDNLDKKVSMIQVTVDNQINKNISIIAEGHLSLNKKLDESLRVMQKQEIMDLQMTSLENNIQKIKIQLGYAC